MADETNRDDSNTPHHQTSTSQHIAQHDRKETSFAKSFRASIQKVSNVYEQTSKIYSKMGEGSHLVEEDEKPFGNDDEKNFREKSKTLLEGG